MAGGTNFSEILRLLPGLVQAPPPCVYFSETFSSRLFKEPGLTLCPLVVFMSRPPKVGHFCEFSDFSGAKFGGIYAICSKKNKLCQNQHGMGQGCKKSCFWGPTSCHAFFASPGKLIFFAFFNGNKDFVASFSPFFGEYTLNVVQKLQTTKYGANLKENT